MFSTPRLIVAAAALAIVAAVVPWIYRQGGDDVRTSIERQNAGKCRRSTPGGGH